MAEEKGCIQDNRQGILEKTSSILSDIVYIYNKHSTLISTNGGTCSVQWERVLNDLQPILVISLRFSSIACY